MLGITFSMVPLVLVIILANGMIDGITKKIIMVDSGLAKAYALEDYDPVQVQQFRGRITEELGLETQLLYEGYGVLFSQQTSHMVALRAVEDDSHHMKQLEFHAGEPVMTGQQIIVSQQLADFLDVEVKDRVTLLSFTEQPSGEIRYKPTLLTVSATASTGYHLLDEGMVYIPIDYGPTVLPNADALVIRILPGDRDLRGSPAAFPVDRLRNILGPGWLVSSWQDQYAGLYRNYQSTKVLLYLVMALIVAAAGVHISSCAVMIILEHTSSIGILRSMGVGTGRIRSAFVLTGMCIGIIGSLFGIAIGVLLGSQLNSILQLLQTAELRAMDYYLSSIEIRIPVLEIVIVFLYGMTVSFVSSLIPTRHLKRMSPLKIITSS